MDCPTGKLCDGVSYYDETVCDDPMEGYFCEGSALKKCTSKYSMYCTSCNATKCLSCANLFYLSGNDCKQCSVGCTKCTSSSYCTQCEAYRVLDTTTHTCNIPCTHYIPNCIYCYDATKCQNCIGGYYVDSSNKCLACTVLNCATCAKDGTCESCNQGYHLSKDKKTYAVSVRCVTEME